VKEGFFENFGDTELSRREQSNNFDKDRQELIAKTALSDK
jgi:hypothetical protein